MKTILKYLKPYRVPMAFGLFIKITGTFADLGLPWVLSYILDEVIPTGKISLILLWGMVMFALAVAARQFNIIANRKASKVARDSVQLIRHDMFQKIGMLSGTQIDQLTVPSLISRMTSDTYNLHTFIGMIQRLGVRAPIILIGGIILTATLDPVLTLVLTATLPLLALVVSIVSKLGVPMYVKTQESVDHMVRTIRENISGIRVIKALSKTEYEKERFHQVNDEVVASEQKAQSIMALSGPFMNLLLNCGLAFVVIVGAYRVNAGQTQPGKIIAFLSYFTMILNAMLMITRMFVIYSKASASAARIEEVLSKEQELKVIPAKISNPDACFIKFDHVNFSYEKKEDKRVLSDISFQIKKGGSLGIIGGTGSGKTTIVNLLMRFYDIDSGSIRIAGEEISSFELTKLRSMFGTVFQNDIIFADTLQENISFGRDLSLDDVKKASRQACADSFIEDKENAYEFEAAIKGANLSGGQKQRILIARALAAHPEILVLDDSSSALDYKTDAALRKTIREEFTDTTIIMIAQRISSVMYMDKVLVLEEGKAIGYGSHEELLESCQIYKEIYESQMGGIS